MEWMRRLVSVSLALMWLATTPLCLAAQGGRGDEVGSAVIGYQPIPNSELPNYAASQSYPAAQAQGMMAPSMQSPAEMTLAQAPQMSPMAGGPMQPAVPLRSGPRSGAYDYTVWLVGQGPYTLGRDDIIRIVVRNQPDFTGDFVVGPDGSIQYNYIGDIPVLSMTKYEVQQVLTKLLERYIRVPQVTVTIMGYNSKAVYVIGEVNRPGKYIMRGDVIKLREAIVAAGLPTRTAALWRTHIIKPDIDNPRVRKVNLKKILYGGKLQEDVDLDPGEIVVVPSTVLHAVNNFLSDLLNPVTRAAATAAIGAGI